jgi:hypothetical protein
MDRTRAREWEARTSYGEGKAMKRSLGIIGTAVIAVLLLIGGAHGLHSGWKNNAPGRTFRPDKEDVAVGHAGHVVMQDPCVPRSSIHLPTARPQAC